MPLYVYILYKYITHMYIYESSKSLTVIELFNSLILSIRFLLSAIISTKINCKFFTRTSFIHHLNVNHQCLGGVVFLTYFHCNNFIYELSAQMSPP